MKKIPTFCCCTENGSITAELLMEMIKAIDNQHVFDRSDGILPFLLLDGHGSRFNLTFLEYINDTKIKGTKQNICIRAPYDTSYWQVGDNAEHNSCFKMFLSRAKSSLLQTKSNARLTFAIAKTDIIQIVNEAWGKSFAHDETNCKAIAEHGWGPLNYS